MIESPYMRLAIAVAIGTAIFFLTQAAIGALQRRGLSRFEQAEVAREEARAEEARVSLYDKLKMWLARQGYIGDPFPILLVLFAGYLAMVTTLQALGVQGPVGVIGALPATAGSLFIILDRLAVKRALAFSNQLLTMLKQLRDLLISGRGVRQSLEYVVGTAEEPLRSELQTVLDKATVGESVAEAFADIKKRYPSRALTMFCVALKVSETRGAELTPALNQCITMLEQSSELAAEAKAEVASAKGEFNGAIILMTIFVFLTIRTIPKDAQSALFEMPGIALFIGALAWGGFGIVWIRRMITHAVRGTK